MRRNAFPPPYLLGTAALRSDDPAMRIHRICSDVRWRGLDLRGLGLRGTLRNLFLVLVWPVVALRRAVLLALQRGPAVRAAYGKGLARQVIEMVSLACRCHVLPTCYYRFELYDAGRYRRAAEYLPRIEIGYTAYRFLLSVYPCPGRALKNKRWFADACREAGLPHARVIMAFVGGRRIEHPQLAAELPHHDLFVKRAFGKGGKGGELWRATTSGEYVSAGGRTLTRGALTEHLASASRSQRGGLLIQPALSNAAALRDLSAGALCTVRMMSIRNEAGAQEVTNASLRMAVDPAASVDNFHAGGIAAPIDIATGRMGQACDLGRAASVPVWHSRHPLTGGQIEGRIVPMWSECIALALKAHAAFPERIVVGWDIAVLEDGPCLIEANEGPGLDIFQRPLRQPIGNERLGQLIALNLERAWAKAMGS
jgi:hypothetical protein